MSKILNTKIQLRTDSESNWRSINPILKTGEIAIVKFDNGTEDLKIGNGLSSFTQLSYLYQTEIKSDKVTAKEVTAKSISQGYNVKSTPTSLATGIFSEANGNFNVVHGIEAKALSTDDYAFVYNGVNLPLDGQNFYTSHGEGSFSINPLSGLCGFYIGEENLSSILNNYFLSNEISDYYTKKQSLALYADLEKQISSASETISSEVSSNYVRLSSEATQNLSTNLDVNGYIRVGGITAQGRKFNEIATSLIPISSQSRTMIGQTYMLISTDYVNNYFQGHTYLLTTDVDNNMEYKDITHSVSAIAVYDEENEDLELRI